MSKTRLGYAGADDPAYKEEHDELAKLCRAFLDVHGDEDFDAMLVLAGMLAAQTAKLWLLSSPGGVMDPATMYARPGERIIRVPLED